MMSSNIIVRHVAYTNRTPLHCHFTAKNQNQYLKGLKASLKPNECIIILDFAENFSFVVQDAAQAFHWNNTQATIHLVVVYHMLNNGDLCHRAFACISDHMTHDTVAVVFVEKLLNDYVKLYLPQLQKIHYFSDRSCAQYKNYKNFPNLIFHVQGFWYYSRVEFLCNFPWEEFV